MASKSTHPAERLVVELALTPRHIATIERQERVSLLWARSTYARMKRHRLRPINRSWSDWLQRYIAAKHTVLKRLS